jgi:riboflavin synthase, alpha subunit
MFTGIVTDLGEVLEICDQGDRWFRLRTAFDVSNIPLGSSVACSGVCLTVIEHGADWFAVTASAETLARTTMKAWCIGTRVNLERALRLGDELGGHLVSGHVDDTAAVAAIENDGASKRFRFQVADRFVRFLAPKGSVAIDGVSLTVNEAEGLCFGVNLIPHTLSVTTLGSAQVGTLVNLEVDLLARYVARQLGADAA